MSTVPSPEDQLFEVRRGADRLLGLLLVLHFPAALGLAAAARHLAGRDRRRRRRLRGRVVPGAARARRRSGRGSFIALRPDGLLGAVHQRVARADRDALPHLRRAGVPARLPRLAQRSSRRPRSSPSTTSSSCSSRTAARRVWVMNHEPPLARHGAAARGLRRLRDDRAGDPRPLAGDRDAGDRAAARRRRRRARPAGAAGGGARAPRPQRHGRRRRGRRRDPAQRHRPGRDAGPDDPDGGASTSPRPRRRSPPRPATPSARRARSPRPSAASRP